MPKRIFAVLCVSYGPYTLLQNDSFFIFISFIAFYTILYCFWDITRYWSKMPIFTTRCCASTVYAVVMCLTIHLSVTRKYRTKTAKHGITQTTLYKARDSSFLMPKISAQFWRGHPQLRRQIRGGVGSDWRFSTKSCYISKTVLGSDILNACNKVHLNYVKCIVLFTHHTRIV